METLKDLQLKDMMVKHWALSTTKYLVLLILIDLEKNFNLELMNQTLKESSRGLHFDRRITFCWWWIINCRGLLNPFLMEQGWTTLMKNLNDFQLDHLMVQRWSSLIVHWLFFLVIPNMDKSLVVSKMHHLLYFLKTIEGITEGTMIGTIEGII